MLNEVRKPGLKLWLLAKIAGYKPKIRIYSPLQIIFIAKNPLGYPLVPATYKLVAHNRFVFRLPDPDIKWKMPLYAAFSILEWMSGDENLSNRVRQVPDELTIPYSGE